MAFIQDLGCLRSPVSTYANLPIVDNVLGDLRICSDVGVLYTWMIESSSGDLTSWKKVTVSSYNDLTGRPSVTTKAIDDAALTIRNIFMNYILILFKSVIIQSANVYKMFDGSFDNFSVEDSIDDVHSSNYKWLPWRKTFDFWYPAFWYKNNYGGFDKYTQLLLQPIDYPGEEAYDLCRSQFYPYGHINNAVSHFFDETFTFDGSRNSYIGIDAINMEGKTDVEGVDFTWDLWVRFDNLTGRRYIIFQFDIEEEVNLNLVHNFLIEKNADNKIRVYYKSINDVEIETVGSTSVVADTWYHLAVQRRNGYFEIFLNGVKDATSATADNHAIKPVILRTVSNPFWNIAGDYFYHTGAWETNFSGQMDEIRYSHGIARYPSNFTPPTEAYNTPTEEAPCNNMVLQSQGYEANYIPTSARFVIVVEDDGDVEPNTDIKAFVSRDGGTTFTQADLAREFEVDGGYYLKNALVRFYIGTFDLLEQPNGKEMVWKITTHNNKEMRIRYAALNWR